MPLHNVHNFAGKGIYFALCAGALTGHGKFNRVTFGHYAPFGLPNS